MACPQERQERARREVGAAKMESQLAIPVVDRAFGDRAAHPKSSDHVHEGAKPIAVVPPDEIGQPGDGFRVRQIARVSAGGLSRLPDFRCPCFRFLEGAIHQDERGAQVGERSGDDLADLAIAADAGEKNA
jgi:hypothetical protein